MITSKGVRVYTVARETASSEQVVHARLIIYREKKNVKILKTGAEDLSVCHLFKGRRRHMLILFEFRH